VPGNVIGVRVGLERAHDPDVFLLCSGEVALNRKRGIDDDRLAGLFVADEVRRAPKVVVDELSEDHAFDRNISDGLFSESYGCKSQRRRATKVMPAISAAPPSAPSTITHAGVPEPAGRAGRV